MSYKYYLTNNIFDTQSHFKMTAAFITNKLFSTTISPIYTQNIYTLS